MILKDVENKLEELRTKWKEHPEKRGIYKLQARPLLSALRIYYREHPQEKIPLDIL